MLQKLYVRNISDGDNNPAGGFVRGIGIEINWQDGPLKDPKTVPSDGPCEDRPESFSPKCDIRGPERYLQEYVEKEGPRHNGAFVEGVILAAVKRLSFYQASKFACPENADAINLLNKAIDILEARTSRRVAAGTEGTHKGA